jgi:hypothetical protein
MRFRCGSDPGGLLPGIFVPTQKSALQKDKSEPRLE